MNVTSHGESTLDEIESDRINLLTVNAGATLREDS